MKIVIVILLLAIIASLFSAGYFMFTDRGRTSRMANALTLRIVLSLSVIGLLILGYLMGWIQPHGLRP